MQCPDDLTLAGQRAGECRIRLLQRFGVLRESEIEEFDAGLADMDIRRLQVTMRDSFSVSRIQSVEDLARTMERSI